MPQYIPYSKRNKVKDPDLAGLLDYCERVMGWDIDDHGYDDLLHSFGSGSQGTQGIQVNIWYDGETQILIPHAYEQKSIRIPTELFYKTYKTLLPVIRDLYSK